MRPWIITTSHLPGHRQGSVQVKGRNEITTFQAPIVGRPEAGDGVQDRIACGVTETAMAHGLQHLVESLDFSEVIRRTVAPVQFVHEIFEQGSSDPAGGAKATTFVLKEMDEIARHLKHVPALVENHEGTRRGKILETNTTTKLFSTDANT